MPRRVPIDAGPLIAYLNPDDAWHLWAVDQFKRFRSFVSCESVLAEVCARMAYYGQNQSRALDLLETGILFLDFDLGRSANRVKRLMQKYADRPMDLADACLVVMTENYDDSAVVTLDRRDFQVYRRFGRDIIPLIAPQD